MDHRILKAAQATLDLFDKNGLSTEDALAVSAVLRTILSVDYEREMDEQEMAQADEILAYRAGSSVRQ